MEERRAAETVSLASVGLGRRGSADGVSQVEVEAAFVRTQASRGAFAARNPCRTLESFEGDAAPDTGGAEALAAVLEAAKASSALGHAESVADIR